MVAKEIPPSLRQRAERELMAGEKILWAGKPRALMFSPLDLLTPLAVFCLLLGCTLTPAETAPLWMSLTGRALLLGTGVLGILAPAAQRVARGYMLCLVTTHRAFRIYPRFFGWWKTESYGSQRLHHLRLKAGGDGYGDILFGYYLLASFTPISWGFKDIPQARQAYALLQQLRQQAANAKPCTLPAPATPIATDTLTADQQRTLQNALEAGEELCYAERAQNKLFSGTLLRLLLQAALCVLLSALIAVFLLHQGWGIRFAVTAAFYLCLLYVFVQNAALHLREFRLNRRRFYVLTTRRALVLHPDIGTEQAYPLTRYLMQEHRIRPDGSGALILGYAHPDTADVQDAVPQGFLHLRVPRAIEKLLSMHC